MEPRSNPSKAGAGGTFDPPIRPVSEPAMSSESEPMQDVPVEHYTSPISKVGDGACKGSGSAGALLADGRQGLHKQSAGCRDTVAPRQIPHGI
jgi:hypothetical protein